MAQHPTTVSVSIRAVGLDRVAAQAETARQAMRRVANASRTANQEIAKLRDMLAEIGIEYVEDQEVTD